MAGAWNRDHGGKLSSRDLPSLLSYTTPDHLARGATMPSGPGPSPGQSDWGIFSVEVPLSHMTVGHCRNSKTQQHSGQQQDGMFLRMFPQNRRKVFPVVGQPTHRSCVALNKHVVLSGFSLYINRVGEILATRHCCLGDKSPYSKSSQLLFL